MLKFLAFNLKILSFGTWTENKKGLMKKCILFFLGFLIFYSTNGQPSFSPEVFASGGGVMMENDSVAFHFTIGEPFTETFKIEDSVFFTQGFQQPWGLINRVLEVLESSLEIKVYPNPTSGLFTIEFSPAVNESMTFVITDLLGKEVFSETSKGIVHEKQIDLYYYSGNIFLLNIYSDKNEIIGSFKIQKIR